MSANFTAVFLEVANLIKYRIEHTVILDYITQYKNKLLEYNSNESVKFHRLERIMEESVSTFHSVVEAKQHNGGPQKNRPL